MADDIDISQDRRQHYLEQQYESLEEAFQAAELNDEEPYELEMLADTLGVEDY